MLLEFVKELAIDSVIVTYTFVLVIVVMCRLLFDLGDRHQYKWDGMSNTERFRRAIEVIFNSIFWPIQFISFIIKQWNKPADNNWRKDNHYE